MRARRSGLRSSRYNFCVPLADGDSVLYNAGSGASIRLAFDKNEKYASGDCPNNHPGGDGLPRYAAQNRNIENADIVLWHSFGHTHICKPEDFPIMPVEYAGFMLKPTGFFSANAAGDIPPDRNSRSMLAGEPKDASAGSCCHTS